MGEKSKLKLLDVVVSPGLINGISGNLSKINSVINSRERFYNVCLELMDSGAFYLIDRGRIEALRVILCEKGIDNIDDARVVLQSLKATSSEVLDVSNITIDTPDTAEIESLRGLDYATMMDKLKVYMYATHGRAKMAQKEARAMLNTRDLLKRAESDTKLDRAYGNSFNNHYIMRSSEALNRTGAYRIVAETLVGFCKESIKIQSKSTELADA